MSLSVQNIQGSTVNSCHLTFKKARSAENAASKIVSEHKPSAKDVQQNILSLIGWACLVLGSIYGFISGCSDLREKNQKVEQNCNNENFLPRSTVEYVDVAKNY